MDYSKPWGFSLERPPTSSPFDSEWTDHHGIVHRTLRPLQQLAVSAKAEREAAALAAEAADRERIAATLGSDARSDGVGRLSRRVHRQFGSFLLANKLAERNAAAAAAAATSAAPTSDQTNIPAAATAIGVTNAHTLPTLVESVPAPGASSASTPVSPNTGRRVLRPRTTSSQVANLSPTLTPSSPVSPPAGVSASGLGVIGSGVYVRPVSHDVSRSWRARLDLLPPTVAPHPLSRDADDPYAVRPHTTAATTPAASVHPAYPLQLPPPSSLASSEDAHTPSSLIASILARHGGPTSDLADVGLATDTGTALTRLEAAQLFDLAGSGVPFVPPTPAVAAAPLESNLRTRRRRGIDAPSHTQQLQRELFAMVSPHGAGSVGGDGSGATLLTPEAMAQMKRIARALKNTSPERGSHRTATTTTSTTSEGSAFPASLQALAQQHRSGGVTGAGGGGGVVAASFESSTAPLLELLAPHVAAPAAEETARRIEERRSRPWRFAAAFATNANKPNTTTHTTGRPRGAPSRPQADEHKVDEEASLHDSNGTLHSTMSEGAQPPLGPAPNFDASGASVSLSMFRAASSSTSSSPGARRWSRKSALISPRSSHRIPYQSSSTSRTRAQPYVEREETQLREVDPDELEEASYPELETKTAIERLMRGQKEMRRHAPHATKTTTTATTTEAHATEEGHQAEPEESKEHTAAHITLSPPLSPSLPSHTRLKRLVHTRFLVDDVPTGAMLRAGLIIAPDESSSSSSSAVAEPARPAAATTTTAPLKDEEASDIPFPTRTGSRLGLAVRSRSVSPSRQALSAAVASSPTSRSPPRSTSPSPRHGGGASVSLIGGGGGNGFLAGLLGEILPEVTAWQHRERQAREAERRHRQRAAHDEPETNTNNEHDEEQTTTPTAEASITVAVAEEAKENTTHLDDDKAHEEEADESSADGVKSDAGVDAKSLSVEDNEDSSLSPVSPSVLGSPMADREGTIHRLLSNALSDGSTTSTTDLAALLAAALGSPPESSAGETITPTAATTTTTAEVLTIKHGDEELENGAGTRTSTLRTGGTLEVEVEVEATVHAALEQFRDRQGEEEETTASVVAVSPRSRAPPPPPPARSHESVPSRAPVMTTTDIVTPAPPSPRDRRDRHQHHHRRHSSRTISGSSSSAVVPVVPPTFSEDTASRIAAGVHAITRRRTATTEARRTILSEEFARLLAAAAAASSNSSAPATNADGTTAEESATSAHPHVQALPPTPLVIDLAATTEKRRRRDQRLKEQARSQSQHAVPFSLAAVDGGQLDLSAVQPLAGRSATGGLSASSSSQHLSRSGSQAALSPSVSTSSLAAAAAATRRSHTHSIVTSETRSRLVRLLARVDDATTTTVAAPCGSQSARVPGATASLVCVAPSAAPHFARTFAPVTAASSIMRARTAREVSRGRVRRWRRPTAMEEDVSRSREESTAATLFPETVYTPRQPHPLALAATSTNDSASATAPPPPPPPLHALGTLDFLSSSSRAAFGAALAARPRSVLLVRRLASSLVGGVSTTPHHLHERRLPKLRAQLTRELDDMERRTRHARDAIDKDNDAYDDTPDDTNDTEIHAARNEAAAAMQADLEWIRSVRQA